MGTGSQPFLFSPSPQSNKAQVIPEIKTGTGLLKQQRLWQAQRHSLQLPKQGQAPGNTWTLQDPEDMGPALNPSCLQKPNSEFCAVSPAPAEGQCQSEAQALQVTVQPTQESAVTLPKQNPSSPATPGQIQALLCLWAGDKWCCEPG